MIQDTTPVAFLTCCFSECEVMRILRFFEVVWLSIVASIVGMALIRYDASVYFGSWFYYLILIIFVARKSYRWINLSFFLFFNAVIFWGAVWIVTGWTWTGILLMLASAIMGGASIYSHRKTKPLNSVKNANVKRT